MKKKKTTCILLEYKRQNTLQPILCRQHYFDSKSRQNHFKTKKSLKEKLCILSEHKISYFFPTNV